MTLDKARISNPRTQFQALRILAYQRFRVAQITDKLESSIVYHDRFDHRLGGITGVDSAANE